MKRLLFFLSLILLFAACTSPMGEMEDADMAMDDASMDEMRMEEMPAMTEGELTVENVQANLSLPSDTGSLWMYILNGTDTDEALLGGEIPGCDTVELHDMTMEDDVMIMRPVEGGEIPIPAGEVVELKRGGLHVMCIGKADAREIGTSVDIVLSFANAGDITVTGEVVPAGGMVMDHGSMNHDADGEEHGDEKMDHDADGEGHDEMDEDEKADDNE